MALISIDKAAAQIGVSPQTIEAWAKQGLLTVHRSPDLSELSPSARGFLTMQKLVEADQSYQVAEGLGWLHLSAERWDSSEE